MTNTLTLLPPDEGCEGGCKPDQDPWKPDAHEDVRIINDSGSTQELWGITDDCLLKRKNGRPKKGLVLKNKKNGRTWLGKAGKVGINGTYRYNDGCPDDHALGVRTGQIDPS